MKNFLSILLAPAAAIAATAQADAALVAHFPMDVRGGQITEQISGERYYVQGHFTPENLPGAEGQALRFDGYTSYINARQHHRRRHKEYDRVDVGGRAMLSHH